MCTLDHRYHSPQSTYNHHKRQCARAQAPSLTYGDFSHSCLKHKHEGGVNAGAAESSCDDATSKGRHQKEREMERLRRRLADSKRLNKLVSNARDSILGYFLSEN